MFDEAWYFKMYTFSLAVAAALLAGGAQAATLTPITSWNGSTGYVEGRPLVVGRTFYGVMG